MQKIEFGSTGLVIEKNGFGCLPIQRISETEAVKLLHKACDGGINFFATARAYSDSEQKVGAAFSGMRDRIVLAWQRLLRGHPGLLFPFGCEYNHKIRYKQF